MENIQGQANILTEEELTLNEKILFNSFRAKALYETDHNLIEDIITSHRAIQERNRNLVLENDELNAQVITAKEFLEWAARIIDSGMGAGILRYYPVQFFIDYHAYIKTLEETK